MLDRFHHHLLRISLLFHVSYHSIQTDCILCGDWRELSFFWSLKGQLNSFWMWKLYWFWTTAPFLVVPKTVIILKQSKLLSLRRKKIRVYLNKKKEKSIRHFFSSSLFIDFVGDSEGSSFFHSFFQHRKIWPCAADLLVLTYLLLFCHSEIDKNVALKTKVKISRDRDRGLTKSSSLIGFYKAWFVDR